jgi:hypothetical protein
MTYTKGADGKGLVTINSTISADDMDQASESLKVAIDTGDASKVQTFQKYRAVQNSGVAK